MAQQECISLIMHCWPPRRSLKNNRISSSLPSAVCGCVNLTTLDITSNQFVGALDVFVPLPMLRDMWAASNPKLRYNGTWPGFLRALDSRHRGAGNFSCRDLSSTKWPSFSLDDSYAGYSHCSCDTQSTLPPSCFCSRGMEPHIDMLHCVMCRPGHVNRGDMLLCVPCGRGEESNSSRTQCLPCIDGWANAATGAMCARCDAGKESSAGHTTCSACQDGWYNPAPGQMCVRCGAGQLSNPLRTGCVSQGDSSKSTGLVAGVVAGSVVLFILGLFAGVAISRHRQRSCSVLSSEVSDLTAPLRKKEDESEVAGSAKGSEAAAKARV